MFPQGGGAGRVKENGSGSLAQPQLTDCQWGLGQVFLALLWN